MVINTKNSNLNDYRNDYHTQLKKGMVEQVSQPSQDRSGSDNLNKSAELFSGKDQLLCGEKRSTRGPLPASSEGDLHQEEPLLSTSSVLTMNGWSSKNGSKNNSTNSPCNVSSNEDDPYYCRDDKTNNGSVAVDLSFNIPEEVKYPQERFKTFVAFLILIANSLLTTMSLAIVHDRVPDRDAYKPLPDTVLDIVEPREWAILVSEIFIMITTNLTIAIAVFHKHRFIVFRRLFLMLSLLYMIRSMTMFVTVLPVSNTYRYCSPKSNHTSAAIVMTRAFQLFSGLGLTMNGKHTYCGDYIFSGHTTILIMCYMMISEYTPRRYFWLHWAVWIMAFAGVTMVLVSHGHYTIDVIVAYFITTRLFWLYHTLASNEFLKKKNPMNYLAREWWFSLFLYFEGNVQGPLPLEYDIPIQWPLFR